MKYLFYVLSLLYGLLCAASAQAQIAVTHTSSVCIDPPDLFVIASTEKDKDQYKNCKRWSPLSNTAEIFNINDFMKSDSSIPPVNRFAKAIIYNWTGKNHVSPLPTSFLLYERPLQFGLEEVNRNSEERLLKTLIVWKPKIKDGSGMIAYVVCDDLDVAVDSPPLAKYLVLYPSFSGEGELRTRTQRNSPNHSETSKNPDSCVLTPCLYSGTNGFPISIKTSSRKFTRGGRTYTTSIFPRLTFNHSAKTRARSPVFP